MISPTRLYEWRKQGTNTIAVVGGTKLGPALRAALLGKFFRTVVTSLSCAIQLLPPEKRPDEYREMSPYHETEETPRARRR
jgi:hypothetical protein